MTQEYVNEGNEIIAEFMGGVESKTLGDRFYEKVEGVGIVTLKGGVVGKSQLRFNSDWNWIHPVLQKLEEMGCYVWMEYVALYQCKIVLFKNEKTGRFEEVMGWEGTNGGDTPIQATFKAVVEFLKKYNELGYGV